MKRLKAIVLTTLSLLVALVLFLTLSRAVANSTQDKITVLDADAVITNTTMLEQDLQNVTTGVEPRFFLQYVEQISAMELNLLPESIYPLLTQTSDRIFLQYAEQSHKAPLSYPVILINDSIPPQTSRIMARMVTTDTAVISWSTDEFANSAVMYGRQSGLYELGVSQSLYVKEHQVTLADLVPEARYFYKVRSADQSGNAYSSSEHTFVARIEIYLPLIFKVEVKDAVCGLPAPN